MGGSRFPCKSLKAKILMLIFSLATVGTSFKGAQALTKMAKTAAMRVKY
jgi:hypothetical protein